MGWTSEEKNKVVLFILCLIHLIRVIHMCAWGRSKRPKKETQKGKIKNTKVQKSKRFENVEYKRCENIKSKKM